MSEFLKGLNWHENKLNMMAARLTLSNDWEVSIVDWSKTRWPKSGYEIAAINPMGHVVFTPVTTYFTLSLRNMWTSW